MTGTAAKLNLAVRPARALNDQAVDIRIAGLSAHSTATIRARLVDDFGREWTSHATFVADESGVISASGQAPSAGTYTSVDGMGLFWSMAPADGRMVGGLIKNGVSPTTVDMTVEIDGNPVAESKIERLFVADGVERTPVREDGLVGTLFLPPGEGPFPGVLIFTGSGGGIEEGRAALLASHGFAAFALAYFNADGLPDSLIDIPLEYFDRGLRWMADRPKVSGDHLGITGQSRGGELVLLLAATFPSVKAVVAGVPSGVVWGGFGPNTDEIEPPPAAWTYGNQPIPSVPRDRSDVDLGIKEGDPIPLTPYFLKALENKTGVEQAGIAVEHSRAAIMMVSGEDDAMWPSTFLAQMAEDRLRRHHYAHPYVHLKYPQAGHSIKPPFSPTTVTAMEHPVDGGLYALGGTPEGNARANADSWPRIIEFLKQHLVAPSGQEDSRSVEPSPSASG